MANRNRLGGPGPREWVTPKKNLAELFNSFIYALAFGLVWMILSWGCVGFAWLGDPHGEFILWITLHFRWWWIVALLGFPISLIGLLVVVWVGLHDPNYEPLNDIMPRTMPLTPMVRVARGAFSLLEAIVKLGHKEPRPNVHIDVDYDDGIRAGKDLP